MVNNQIWETKPYPISGSPTNLVMKHATSCSSGLPCSSKAWQNSNEVTFDVPAGASVQFGITAQVPAGSTVYENSVDTWMDLCVVEITPMVTATGNPNIASFDPDEATRTSVLVP